ncbi:amino acid adenylation domain-containing protein [Burkholderia glumae]|uniref:amino acid adenylation domain-containing protein n=1 Tax=Burkholderia glumae TaxID=337 RepID=UPI0021508ED8|nr:amino acid adenylation domain-containing protein [Burkholderia glumae]UVS95975.1 amino acid adenylation domain-containing protein [Burkholderia glumae]
MTQSAPSVYAQFEQACAAQPDALALEGPSGQLSYAGLLASVAAIGTRLAEAGVTPGTLVGVLLPRDFRLPAAILAAFGSQAVYVPLTEKYPPERIREIVLSHRITHVVTSEALTALLPPECRAIVLPSEPGAAQGAGWRPAAPRGDDAPAYVVFTSGSTGTPKGVLIGEASLRNLIDWYRAAYRPDERRAVLASTQITFDLSLFELVCTLCSGSKVVLVDSILQLLEADAQFDVSLINTVPSAARELVRRRRFPAATRVVNLAGEALYQDLVDAIHDAAPQVRQVYNLYGPSEDTTYSTGHAVPRHGSSRTVSIGRSLPGKTAHLLDDALMPVEPGAVGEICLSGEGVALGYLNDPRLTEQKFPTVAQGPLKGLRLYRTGDLGQFDDDGLLRYLGRADRQVKVRGVRIEPGEVEVALRGIAGVADAAVVKVVDPSGNDQLVALVVPQPGQVPGHEILDQLQSRLPAFMVPSRVEPIAAIPLNGNGKTDRTALERIASACYRAEPAVDDLAEQVREVVATLMARTDVASDTDFFRIGGNSLLSAQLTFLLQQRFAVTVSIADVFRLRTPAALAAAIGSRRAANQPAEARSAAPAPSPAAAVAAPVAPPAAPAPAQPRGGAGGPAVGGTLATAAQRGIWLLENSPGGRAVSNAPLVFDYSGTLERARLARCVTHWLARHPILRSTYAWEDGALRIREREAAPFVLASVDLHAEPDEQRMARAEALIAAEAMRPFDLRHDPMLRVTELRLGDHAGRLIFVFHHIAVDDRAMNVLFAELERDYRAGDAPLAVDAAPARRFADFAAETRGGTAAHADLAYWVEQLRDYRGATAYLVAPDAKPVARFAGRLHHHRLPAAISRDFEAAAARRAVTPFALFTTAVTALLRHGAGTEDVTIGSFFSQRDHFADGELVGFFVNTLPLRVRSGADWDLDRLAQAVALTLADAQTHRHVAAEDIFDALQASTALRRAAFRVMVNLEPEQAETLEMDGFTARRVPLDRGVAKYDLLFSLRKEEGSYRVLVEYHTELYSETLIARICANLDRVLAALTGTARVALAALALPDPRDEAAWSAAPTDDGGAAAPADFRALVREIWAGEVGHGDFGDGENFFDVGGSSLKIMSVYETLSQRLAERGIDKELDIVALFEHVTVGTLADFLEEWTAHDALA